MIDEMDGSTSLDPNESDGLIPDIITRSELNLYERDNIGRAREWAIRSRFLRKNLLSIGGVAKLHREMLCDVWVWAGQFRKSEKNIGVAPHQIQTQLSQACDNSRYRLENQSAPLDEIAVEFHYQLARIHPFPNGNGRHARMCADLLLIYNRQKPFSWHGDALLGKPEIRDEYISAMRAADAGDIRQLLLYARG